MGCRVLKFGGSSVASIAQIKHVAEIIAKNKAPKDRLVVVVSAMGTETNRLRDLAYAITAQPPLRELDMLLTAGERMSMSLLSMALSELEVESRSFTGSQSGILTDGVHTNARIIDILGHRIRQALDEGNVAIVAGFQGMNPETKEITTLGRGGSDLTAVALAATLEAEQCEIYTDVQGVFTADPRMIKTARFIPRMFWQELTELAWMGAGVMHSRAAQLAEDHRIPIVIRSTFAQDDLGTRVEGEYQMETALIRAISHKTNMRLIEFVSSNSAPALLSESVQWFWKNGASPLIAQQSSAGEEQNLIRLLVDGRVVQDFWKYLECEQWDIKTRRAETPDLAAITIVGSGFWQSPEIVGQIMSTIPVTAELVDIRNNGITVGVDLKQLAPCLQDMHAKLMD
jgi:aspartate kinase